MYDLFFKLGIAFFAIEILHKAFTLYMVVRIKLELKAHLKSCVECSEDPEADRLLAETFKSMREK